MIRTFEVRGSSNATYNVTYRSNTHTFTCECPGYTMRATNTPDFTCRHIRTLQAAVRRAMERAVLLERTWAVWEELEHEDD